MNVVDFLLPVSEAVARKGPHDRIVLSSRVRLARNVQGHSFPGRAKKDDRVASMKEIRPEVESLGAFKESFSQSMDRLKSQEKNLLMERHLISREHGSWLLIGHLLTTEELDPDEPARSLCGRCTACITACPTDAIREPFVVDARRCIAYHTIENREEELPESIASSLGGWVAGCDICQEVCPWNHKQLPTSSDPDLQPRPWLMDLRADDLLTWDEDTWDRNLRGSALRRIKPWMWRRNARATQRKPGPSL